MADAARATSAAVVAALRDQGVRAVMLSGDSRATAERIAAELGINEAIAEVLPADEAAKVAELQMRSDPLVVAHAITIARGAVRKMHQDLAWAVGYNSLALPVAAAVFEPLGFVLRPEVGAI